MDRDAKQKQSQNDQHDHPDPVRRHRKPGQRHQPYQHRGRYPRLGSRAHRARPSHPDCHNLWCTGEDSNLRSSQGAADLQSAAINRSATCAQSLRSIPHPARNPHRFGADRFPQLPRRLAATATCPMQSFLAGVSRLGEAERRFSPYELLMLTILITSC